MHLIDGNHTPSQDRYQVEVWNNISKFQHLNELLIKFYKSKRFKYYNLNQMS